MMPKINTRLPDHDSDKITFAKTSGTAQIKLWNITPPGSWAHQTVCAR